MAACLAACLTCGHSEREHRALFHGGADFAVQLPEVRQTSCTHPDDEMLILDTEVHVVAPQRILRILRNNVGVTLPQVLDALIPGGAVYRAVRTSAASDAIFVRC